MHKKYQETLCTLVQEYEEVSQIEEHWNPIFYTCSDSDICVIIFKGTVKNCEAMVSYLNDREFDK